MARQPFTPRPNGQPGSVVGKVVGVRRHGHTNYGNPIMSIDLAIEKIDGVEAHSDMPVVFRISDNAGLVYGIENAEYREKSHEFDVTAAGRISGYTRPA